MVVIKVNMVYMPGSVQVTLHISCVFVLKKLVITVGDITPLVGYKIICLVSW